MTTTILAQKLRLLRKKHNFTQEAVAKQLNIERQTYCNYENEARTPPLDVLIRLSELYHVSIDFLAKDSSKDNLSSDKAIISLTASESELLNTFRALPPGTQEEVLQFTVFKKTLSSSSK